MSKLTFVGLVKNAEIQHFSQSKQKRRENQCCDMKNLLLYVCKECLYRLGSWDYRGFPIGPLLTFLGRFFELKMTTFFRNMINFIFWINRPIWPIFMKKC